MFRTLQVIFTVSLGAMVLVGCATVSQKGDGGSVDAMPPTSFSKSGLDKVRAGNEPYLFYSRLLTKDSPFVMLRKDLRAGKSEAECVRDLSTHYDISQDQARSLVFAMVNAYPRHSLLRSEHALRARIIDDLKGLTQSKPHWAYPVALLSVYLSYDEDCDNPSLQQAMEDISLPEAGIIINTSRCEAPLKRLLAEYPGNHWLLQAARYGIHSSLQQKIALDRLIQDEQMRTNIDFRQNDIWRTTNLLYNDLLQAGLDEFAIHPLDAMPLDAKKWFLTADVSGENERNLASYAFALIAVGRESDAIDLKPWITQSLSECDGDCEPELRIAQALLTNPDPFSVAEMMATSGCKSHCYQYWEALETYFQDAGYHEIAEYAGKKRRELALSDQDRLDDIQSQYTDVLGKRFVYVSREYLELIDKSGIGKYLNPEPGTSSPVPNQAWRRRSPFREIDDTEVHTDAPFCTPLAEQAGVLGKVSIRLIDAKKCGSMLLTLYLSDAVGGNPNGSIGDLWLAYSTDGGNHWNRIYTGLRDDIPYSISTRPNVELSPDGKLQIEADLLDESAGEKSGVRHVVLAARLSSLNADSDGDGLTDVEEYSLLLDSRSDDSDMDGIKDAKDPLPNVAQEADANPDSLQSIAINAVLQPYEKGRFKFIAELNRAEKGSSGSGLPADSQASSRRFYFVVANPGELSMAAPRSHVVVIRPGILKDIEQQFGWMAPVHLENFWISHDGKRALLLWSAPYSSGVYAFREVAGKWTWQDVGEVNHADSRD